ncbi:MAG: glutamate-cysteine ligase family protein [Polyangiaceae bacterium]
MAPPPSDTRPIKSHDDLLEPFFTACKPESEFRIGAEQEKIGLLYEVGGGSARPRAIPYEADATAPSVAGVLRELAASHGWRVEGTGPLIALVKGSASVTLEPGAQLELSGAPLRTIHDIHDEARAHLAELDAISRGLSDRVDLRWLGIGFHPTAAQADLGWVPKARYGVMKQYLPTRGQHGLDMMRRTATVQANFDYSSEENAMRVLRVALRLTPFFTAMFANAPYYEGELWGGASYRAKVWLSVDPDRQGLVPAAIREGARFRDYVEWALDAPMFLVLRDADPSEPGGATRIVPNTGQPFRAFMKDGFDGERATMGDWLTHLNTLFPEVRLKRTIEVRGADSTPPDLVEAPAALWTGLLYEGRALDEAEALSASFTLDELERLRALIPQHGPRAPFRPGTELARAADVAARMIAIARGGLARRAELRDGVNEGIYLDTIAQLVEKAECPADRLIAASGPGSDWSSRFDSVFLTSAHRKNAGHAP